MTTLIAFHDVDDVQHWLASPKREEIFGPMGISVRTFVDPSNATRAGVLLEVPDMDKFQEVMQSEVAAEAMKYDGVHPETLVMLTEA